MKDSTPSNRSVTHFRTVEDGRVGPNLNFIPQGIIAGISFVWTPLNHHDSDRGIFQYRSHQTRI